MTTRSMIAAACAALALGWPTAHAHEGAEHQERAEGVRKEQQAWGIAGDAKDARRVIRIAMGDDMRFSPSDIRVRLGETVRFVVANRGQVLHEIVIGTPQVLKEHAALMRRFPDMQHDEAHMAHVKPGRTGELVWTFNRPGQFSFACLIPGHYEAGMVGRIDVAPQGGKP